MINRSISNGDSGSDIRAFLNNHLQVIDVKNYGAVGDGETDDYDAIMSAINSNSNKFVRIGSNVSEVYIISKPITPPSNTYLIIDGTLKMEDGYAGIPIAEDISAESTEATVTDAGDYFKVGQWVSVTDDDATATERRKWGNTVIITDIQGDLITFQDGFRDSYTVSSNATIGHTQSNIVIDSVSNVNIFGNGWIDNNKSNQDLWIEPIRVTGGLMEEVRAGCGISVYESDRVTIDGVNIKDSMLHNLSLFEADQSDIRNLYVKNSGDKGVLVFNVSKSKIHDIRSHDSGEDCFTIYANNTDLVVSNLFLKGAGRNGLGLYNNDDSNIIISDVIGYSAQVSITTSKQFVMSNVMLRGCYFACSGTEDAVFYNICVDCDGELIPGMGFTNTANVEVYGGFIKNGKIGLSTSGNTNLSIRGVNISSNQKAVNDLGTDINTKVTRCQFNDNNSKGTGFDNMIFAECSGDLLSFNSGTGTILNGNTYIDVAHGLEVTPSATNINVSQAESLGSASNFWVSDIDDTTFRINVDVDPGKDLTFNWKI